MLREFSFSRRQCFHFGLRRKLCNKINESKRHTAIPWTFDFLLLLFCSKASALCAVSSGPYKDIIFSYCASVIDSWPVTDNFNRCVVACYIMLSTVFQLSVPHARVASVYSIRAFTRISCTVIATAFPELSTGELLQPTFPKLSKNTRSPGIYHTHSTIVTFLVLQAADVTSG